MKNKRLAVALSVVGTLLLTVVVAFAMPGTASAEGTPRVTGVDYYYQNDVDEPDAQETPGIDILTVEGTSDVYIKVVKGDDVIADHLRYNVGENNTTGVVRLDVNSFDSNVTYAVSAYSDRAEANQLFSGTLKAVKAKLDGVAQPVVIGTTTKAADDAHALTAPATYVLNGVTYSNPTAVDGTITYTVDASMPDSVTGSITYVNDKGETLKTTQISGITAGASQTVPVEQILTGDDGYYRSIYLNGSTVTATYGGTKDFTIICKPLTNGTDGVSQYYFATINLVDANGATLATDSLNVTKKYNWTAPEYLYLTGADGKVQAYKLSDTQAEGSFSDGTLALDPAKDKVEGGAKTFSVSYEKVDDTSTRTWSIVYINGADGSAIKTIDGLPTTKSHTPDQTIDVDGTTYIPVKSTKASYSYDGNPTQYVYYVLEGYVAPGTRTVTVNYVNITGGATIAS